MDWFTKYAHFLALSNSFIAQKVANAFLNNIYKLYGLPKTIINDKDKVCMNNFMEGILQNFGHRTAFEFNISPLVWWSNWEGESVLGDLSTIHDFIKA